MIHSASNAFNSEPFIPYARDERTGAIVRLPKTRLKDGEEEYDEAKHKGHLLCPDCDAHIHYSKGSKGARAGSNWNPSVQHFKKNPGQEHWKSCEVAKKEAARELHEKTPVDEKAGFQINLNTLDADVVRRMLRQDFGRAHGPYARERGNPVKFRLKDEELRTMETYAVSNVGDLVKFLESKEPERIQKSIIIYLDQQVEWRRFMLSYSKGNDHKRFKHLVSNLRDHGQAAQPVLMEVITDHGYDPTWRSRRHERAVKSKAIFVERDKGPGQLPTFIIPRVFLNSENRDVLESFKEPGKYLVSGMAVLKTHSDHTGTRHFLSVSVTIPDQVLRADLQDIRKANDLHQQNLAKRHTTENPAPIQP